MRRDVAWLLLIIAIVAVVAWAVPHHIGPVESLPAGPSPTAMSRSPIVRVSLSVFSTAAKPIDVTITDTGLAHCVFPKSTYDVQLSPQQMTMVEKWLTDFGFFDMPDQLMKGEKAETRRAIEVEMRDGRHKKVVLGYDAGRRLEVSNNTLEERFLALDGAIMSLVPANRASVVPRPAVGEQTAQGFRTIHAHSIGKDGDWAVSLDDKTGMATLQGVGPVEGYAISVAQRERIIEQIATQRFLELPEEIAVEGPLPPSSHATTSLKLDITMLDGRQHTVTVVVRPEASPESDDERRRFKMVWDAVLSPVVYAIKK